jgi:hypothetical protein
MTENFPISLMPFIYARKTKRGRCYLGTVAIRNFSSFLSPQRRLGSNVFNELEIPAFAGMTESFGLQQSHL